MQCPRCKVENDPGHSYCTDCRAELRTGVTLIKGEAPAAEPVTPRRKAWRAGWRMVRLLFSAVFVFLLIVVVRGVDWSEILRGISATKTGVEREAAKPGKPSRPTSEAAPRKAEDSKTKPLSNAESGSLSDLFARLFAKLRQGLAENTSFGAELRGAQANAATSGLNLNSRTRAKVYLDGQFAGFTPYAVKLEPGEHKVSLLADGYQEWNRKVQLKAGQQVSLKAALKKSAAR